MFASPAHEQAVRNLERIAEAMLLYHDAHNHMPPAVLHGKDGRGGPGHSWRVELLPMLGEQALYDSYHFDEPWDSDHNRTLLAKMPAVYRSPMDTPDSIHTSYFGITSNHEPQQPGTTVFWNHLGASLMDLSDGTSDSMGVVEAKRDIPWTRPVDIEYAADKPLPEFGGWFKRGWHASFADGTAKFLASYNDEITVRNLITIADRLFGDGPLLEANDHQHLGNDIGLAILLGKTSAAEPRLSD